MNTQLYSPVKLDIDKVQPEDGFWILFAEFAKQAKADGWTNEELNEVLGEAYKIRHFPGKQAFLKSYCAKPDTSTDDGYVWPEDDEPGDDQFWNEHRGVQV